MTTVIPHPEPDYFGSGEVCSACACTWNMAHGVANPQTDACERECVCHDDTWATLLYEAGQAA